MIELPLGSSIRRMAELPSISPELDEDFLAFDRNRLSVDDHTIYGTPAPVAASTVAKGNRLTDRYQQCVKPLYMSFSQRHILIFTVNTSKSIHLY